MLLKQLLESPKTCSNLVVYDPFRELDREELVREVIGLANADVDGPRNVLFGVNSSAVDGNGIVGISDSAIAELKKAHRLLSDLIAPVLQLAFIFDEIDGKLVGALEIDGCDFGPYIVGQDFSGSLSLGQCWVREGWDLHAVERDELLNGKEPEAAKEPAELTETPNIAVGFNDDPQCSLIELAVPDTSDPPFAQEANELKKTSKLKQVMDTVGTMTTQMLRLGHEKAADFKADGPAEDCDEASKVQSDARNHYYYEEKALQLNFCLCNNGNELVEDVKIELGLPQLPDFDVAERLYANPFDKRSAARANNQGYPKVERRDNGIIVNGTLRELVPGKAKQAFGCALRLAVGPGMQRRKLAILYKLRGPQDQVIGEGRLKIKFGRAAA